MLSQFIGFKEYKEGYKIYKLNKEKTWYLLPDNNTGHQVETVAKYPHAYILGDTEEEILKQIKIKQHQEKHGNGKNGDVACPTCGFKYNLDYIDANDGFYTEAIKEDFQEKINCICGTNFLAKIQVKIDWQIINLDK